MAEPLIMVAPNGARRGKGDHPELPITVPEIVAATQASVAAGAGALHLHVRGADGAHSLDAGLYREALSELTRALPDLPVQITTEAVGQYSPAQQAALIDALRPRWVSASLRELGQAPEIAKRTYEQARAQGTQVQHIIYGPEDMDRLRHWQQDGVLDEAESVILVLGRYGKEVPSTPAALDDLLAQMPPVGDWMVCAFGPSEHACLLHAARRGGNLRVGFENALVDAEGQPWPSVAHSVAALSAALKDQT